MHVRASLATLLLVLSIQSAVAEDWTRFRGPNGAGVSEATGLPTSWTAKDFAWTVELPSRGHSSPVVWGDKVFVTGAPPDGTRQVTCVDAAKGVLLWTKSFAGSKYKMHARNSAASSTPAVDGRRVYILWGSQADTIVQALDHEGTELWKVDLGPFHGEHGVAVSPIVVDDVLIVPNDQDKNGRLIGLDAATGENRWTLPRTSGRPTYATPCVYRSADGSPLVVFTNWKHGITAVDPKSGKIAWERSVFETMKQERSIVSPIVVGDLIVGTCGFTTAQKHFVAVRPTADGKVEEVWRLEKGVPHMPTPVVFEGRIYIVTEKGFATCVDGKTGAVLWTNRLDNAYSASPICVGGNIYAVADDGEVAVFKAGTSFELLSRSPLGHPSQATPAVVGDRIVFRTERHVMALRGR